MSGVRSPVDIPPLRPQDLTLRESIATYCAEATKKRAESADSRSVSGEVTGDVAFAPRQRAGRRFRGHPGERRDGAARPRRHRKRNSPMPTNHVSIQYSTTHFPD